MSTIKAYTDLKQSKKLAEILPIISADMKILPFTRREYRVVPINDIAVCGIEDEIYAWSLAALLGVLPHIQEFYPTLEKINNGYVCRYKGSGIWTNGTNSVDACVAMIIKLHELKML